MSTIEASASVPVDGRPQSAHRLMTAVYVVSATLASALLFTIQPLAVRMVLPDLGGSPAVWNAAMVFFQFALLVGYVLAHVFRSRLGWVLRPWVQIALVGAGVLVLPVAVPIGWSAPSSGQAIWLLGLFVVMLGLPFVALATLSPTIQGWFADTNHPRSAEPYFLYAAGNIGSAVGLLGYPLLIEPLMGLRAQAASWAVGYGLLTVLLVIAALQRARNPQPVGFEARLAAPSVHELAPAVSEVRWSNRLYWALAAAVPSALLLAVTQFISTDVAAVPLLWVVPLTIYLATFVVAFARPVDGCPWPVRLAALLAAIPAVLTASSGVWSSTWLVAGVFIHLAAFGLLAQAIHFRLAAARPHPARLTEFFVWISVGGLIGGVAVALIAPVLFNDVIEYPLLLLAAVALVGSARELQKGPRRNVALVGVTGLFVLPLVLVATGTVAAPVGGAFAIGAAMVGTLVVVPRAFLWLVAVVLILSLFVSATPVLFQARSFFGVLMVSVHGDDHRLVHGTTTHGQQQYLPVVSGEPTIYYAPEGGAGRIMLATEHNVDRHVAVVGLGAGTMAAYNRDGQTMNFFEIDQLVVDVASDRRLFTFISDSAGVVTTDVTDGRVGIRKSDNEFDVIALDAFSSDAIPVHLLTLEAIELYKYRLRANGAILVHVTNRYFDLQPTLARLGDASGLSAYSYTSAYSTWVALVDPDLVESTLREELMHWNRLEADPSAPLWTDDYANLWSAFIGF